MDKEITLSKKLRNDFQLYQKLHRTLFNPKDMRYTSPEYNALSVDLEHCPISQNTFYSNRTSLETNYSNLFTNALDTKENLQSKLFYKRLKLYLGSISSWAQDNQFQDTQEPDTQKQNNAPKITQLQQMQVTHDFFPYYIALICSDSKKSNWSKAKDQIKTIGNSFIMDSSDIFKSTLPLAERSELISYWLDITFPDKLYKLILQINDIVKKEGSYLTQPYLKQNLNLFIQEITDIAFKSKTMQNIFLDYVTERFLYCLSKRKKGDSVMYDLLEDFPLFDVFENYLYTRYTNNTYTGF